MFTSFLLDLCWHFSDFTSTNVNCLQGGVAVWLQFRSILCQDYVTKFQPHVDPSHQVDTILTYTFKPSRHSFIQIQIDHGTDWNAVRTLLKQWKTPCIWIHEKAICTVWTWHWRLRTVFWDLVLDATSSKLWHLLKLFRCGQWNLAFTLDMSCLDFCYKGAPCCSETPV